MNGKTFLEGDWGPTPVPRRKSGTAVVMFRSSLFTRPWACPRML